MNTNIADLVVSYREFEAVVDAEDAALLNDDDSDRFHEEEEALVALLSPLAAVGGLDSGDFYSVENWYGCMAFSFIMNTGRVLCIDVISVVSHWVNDRSFPCKVHFVGNGELVPDRLEVVVYRGVCRIAYRGGSRRECLMKLVKLGVLPSMA